MKRLRLTVFMWAAVVASLSVAAVPAQLSGKISADLSNKLDSIIQGEQTKQKIPGVSVAVAIDNRLSYAKGFGMSDLENSVAANAETVYRTASIAKSMTATAVMQLAEQGRLDLDAPVQKHCASFPQKPWPVTARQLLGHLGGVRHYKSGREASGTDHYYSVPESLAIFKDEPLVHEPGTKFNYTTYGYSLLGCAIEGASGMSYDEYMRKNVFQTAEMTRTTIDDFRMIVPGRARGYMRLDQQTYAQLPEAAKRIARVGEIYNSSLHDTSMKVPGGGLVSTSVDLVKFAIALKSGRLVKKSTLEQMWTQQKTKDGTQTGYGLGWGIGQVAGESLISHSGGQSGTSTLLTMLPSRGIVIAVMCNLQGAALNNITQEIGKTLMSEAGPPGK